MDDHYIISKINQYLYFWRLGSESQHTHLSPCVSFRYNTKLYIEVRRDSDPILILKSQNSVLAKM